MYAAIFLYWRNDFNTNCDNFSEHFFYDCFPNAYGSEEDQNSYRHMLGVRYNTINEPSSSVTVVKRRRPRINIAESADPERPYECDKCSKTYKRNSHLRRHQRLECGMKEPQFQCPYCPRKMRQKNNLKLHLVLKHKSVLSVSMR